MAATADSVVVELVARTEQYDAAINGSSNKSQAGFSKIEKAAAQAEGQVQRSAAGMGSSVSRAANDIERGSARAANASRNLGRQISDIGVGLTGGQSPFLVLSQQAPQVADALADTGGKAAAVAGFFAGPWGAALLAAGSALGVLVGKALEGGDTLEGLVAKLKDQAERSRLSAEADRIFAATQAGVAARVRDTTKALNEQNASLRTNAQLRNVRVRQEAVAAEEQVRQANARLQQAQQRVARSRAPQIGEGGAAAAAGASIAARSGAAAARKELQDAQAAARQANINLNVSRVALAAEQASSRSSAQGRITERFDDQIRAVQRYAVVQAQAGKTVGKAVYDRIADLEAEKAAALATAAASESATKSSARQIATTTRTLTDLRKLEAGATGAERTRLQARITRTEKKLGLLQQGIGAEAASAASAAGRSGPSAEVLARRAEAARIRDVRNNEAYNNELEQLNGQIIAAQRERAVTVEDAARFERDAIESDYRRRREGIAADLSANKYDAAEAASLDQLNEYARLLRLRNVAIDEDARTIREGAQRNALTLDLEREQLEADRSISESREEQRRIDLELVKIKYQQRKAALEALRAAAQVRGDTNAVNDATDQIDALPALERADRTGIDQRYRTRYENYRRGLTDTDRINDAIDAVKIDTLEKVTDELTEATKAALGLKGAFGDIVGELIRIGIQRKIIGPLADALFGKADGSSGSGKIGSAFQSIASLFGGRASGGYVGPRQTVRVNEGRGAGVELLRMGPQGGTVIPLGQTRAARPSGGTTVISAPRFDLKGAVITRELYADMERISAQSAAQARDQAVGIARKGFPSAQARFSQLGTTG